MKKLEDSDTEEYMKNYKKMFIYSNNNIVNYKTKQPIKIKIIPL
jgi:hypothetical protein